MVSAAFAAAIVPRRELQRSVRDDATQRRRLRNEVKQSPPAAK
jgi:hypothetical protein